MNLADIETAMRKGKEPDGTELCAGDQAMTGIILLFLDELRGINQSLQNLEASVQNLAVTVARR